MKSRRPNSHSLDAHATRIGSTKNLAKFLGWSANGKTFAN
jgi:hypothetical protein